MTKSLLSVLSLAVVGMACTGGFRETLVYSSYEVPLNVSSNAEPAYVCYSKDKLSNMLSAYELDPALRAKLDDVKFEEHLVCLIRNAKIIDVAGHQNLGFIRIRDQPTNGVGIAIIKRNPDRFYQFNRR